MKSSEYREILIYVAGITAQIITETLYALHHKNPPIHPDEILSSFYIITPVGKYGGKNFVLKNVTKKLCFFKTL